MQETPAPPQARAMIGKWSVERYIGLVRRWTLIAGAVVMLGVLTGQPRELVLLCEFIAVAAVGWLVAKRGGGKVESLSAGAMMGAALGLVASVSRYIHGPTLGTAMNVIIETILTTVVAPFITVSTTLIATMTAAKKH